MTNSINVTGSSPWGIQDSILIKFGSKTNLFIFPLLVFTAFADDQESKAVTHQQKQRKNA